MQAADCVDIATVFAADEDFELRIDGAGVFDESTDHLFDGGVDGDERMVLEEFLVDVERQEAIGVVAGNGECRLGEVVGTEGSEAIDGVNVIVIAGDFGAQGGNDFAAGDGGCRGFDHRAECVRNGEALSIVISEAPTTAGIPHAVAIMAAWETFVSVVAIMAAWETFVPVVVRIPREAFIPLTSSVNHYDDAVCVAARSVLDVFDNISNPTPCIRRGICQARIASHPACRNSDQHTQNRNVDGWITELRRRVDAFNELRKTKTQTRSEIETGATPKARIALIDAYRTKCLLMLSNVSIL